MPMACKNSFENAEAPSTNSSGVNDLNLFLNQFESTGNVKLPKPSHCPITCRVKAYEEAVKVYIMVVRNVDQCCCNISQLMKA